MNFFTFHTMEQRHLVFVYVGVWLVWGGYLAWVAMQWLRTRDVQDPSDR